MYAGSTVMEQVPLPGTRFPNTLEDGNLARPAGPNWAAQ